MSLPKIMQCPYGGKIRWKEDIWDKFPEFEYIYLECTRVRCDHADWDCRSESFPDDEKGREAAVIDWNRKMNKKRKDEEDQK